MLAVTTTLFELCLLPTFVVLLKFIRRNLSLIYANLWSEILFREIGFLKGVSIIDATLPRSIHLRMVNSYQNKVAQSSLTLASTVMSILMQVMGSWNFAIYTVFLHMILLFT